MKILVTEAKDSTSQPLAKQMFVSLLWGSGIKQEGEGGGGFNVQNAESEEYSSFVIT